MTKEFNITGSCHADRHYMVDTGEKLRQISRLIEKGHYFTINRPRQYGKTTCLEGIEQRLSGQDFYVMFVTFESMSTVDFQTERNFIREFFRQLLRTLRRTGQPQWVAFVESQKGIETFGQLDDAVTGMTALIGKRTVLLVDEVDKKSDNQLFLNFLALLRSKYLMRHKYKTFHSVVLTGVHDVKTLKLKLLPDEEKKYNSPWNIAADFKVDLTFNPAEIATMLEDYSGDTGIDLDFNTVSEQLYYYTHGHPFLVSNLCKIIDEKRLPGTSQTLWQTGGLVDALRILLMQENTNFQSLIKNLENNPELYEFVFKIIINGMDFSFNPHNAVIKIGMVYGILKNENGKIRIHNRIYEQLIYDYMSSNLETSGEMDLHHTAGAYMDADGALDFQKIIRKFQQFMKEQYSTKDNAFIERNGRLLFLAFLKPIINGKGFDFKEVQISEEKRLDVVVTMGEKRYIIELKIWRGEKYHQDGIDQLCDYLENLHEDRGFLLIYDLRKDSGQTGKSLTINRSGKEIFAAWV